MNKKRLIWISLAVVATIMVLFSIAMTILNHQALEREAAGKARIAQIEKLLAELHATKITTNETIVKELRKDAEKLLPPMLKVRAFIGQEEVTGATVALNGTPREAKTPAEFPLEKGQRYKVQVTLPEGRGGKNYSMFTKEVAIENQGQQELRATLEELVLHVPAECRAAPGTVMEPYSYTGWAKEIIHEKSGLELVYIPAGSFIMGSPSAETERGSDEIQHEVTLSQGFYMGKYEITQGQWQAIMGSNPAKFNAVGKDAPVERVSWIAAWQFCNNLGTGFRLPTEAEWEYACRAGTTAAFCYGNDLDASLANFDGGHPYGKGEIGLFRESTVVVGQFKPNAWGLYDMHGNVREWCADWYGIYPTAPVTDPTGPASGSYRVLRGGSWYTNGWRCRSACRGRVGTSVSYDDLGFRVIKILP